MKSMLEKDIKPRNIILYICTVDILIRIHFPLTNFLIFFLILLGSIPIKLKKSPNRIHFVNP